MPRYLVIALLALGCSRATSAPKDAVPGQPLQLVVGESARIANSGVHLRFLSVNDSRCPSDVQCITAGDAGIVLDFSGAGAGRTDTLWLVRQPRMVTYGAYRFEAADLLPYPRTSERDVSKVVTLRVLD